MAEKRNYVRFFSEGEIEFDLGGSGGEVVPARLVDIGFLGLCAFADKKIETGTPVDFKIYIKTIREDFSGKGKVISAQEVKKYRKVLFRIAVMFRDMDREKILSILTKIQDYVNREKRKRWQSGDAGVGLL